MTTRRERIETMLEKEPGDVFLNFSLAMELAKEVPVDSAVRQFDRVLELDQTYLAAHFQKGSLLLSKGRVEEARLALRAGIEIALRIGDQHTAEEMQAVLDGSA